MKVTKHYKWGNQLRSNYLMVLILLYFSPFNTKLHHIYLQYYHGRFIPEVDPLGLLISAFQLGLALKITTLGSFVSSKCSHSTTFLFTILLLDFCASVSISVFFKGLFVKFSDRFFIRRDSWSSNLWWLRHYLMLLHHST